MIRFSGYLTKSVWNNDKKEFEVKRVGELPKALLLCGLNISSKDKDGNTVFGKPIDLKIMVKEAEEGKRIVGLINDKKLVQFDGFFVASNYINKDGKEVKGNAIMITDSTTVIEKVLEKKEAVEEKAKPIEVKESDVW